jgi:ketosteroid isomerase-like protein
LLVGYPALGADPAHEAITAVNQKFAAAIDRGDAAGVAALYTADGQVLPTQSGAVTGTKAITAFWQAGIDAGTAAASLTTLELESHGNTAHEVGTYELRGKDGKVLDQGKFIVIWKKEGATWKIHRDIFNTSLAPAAP